MKKNLIVIVGPTAVGKTKLSIALAKAFSSEIISGDSMQIYKGMDIGTGKVTETEMEAIPHYMLDEKRPDQAYSVAAFQADVDEHIKSISEKGKTAILVGGSGLYIDAVLYDYAFENTKRDDRRTKHYEGRMEREGMNVLYAELQELDAVYAAKVHPNNYRRVIRGLEIYDTSGLTMTEITARQTQTPKYNHYMIGLDMDRELLYKQINQRVDEMVATGLVEEVQALVEQGYEDTQAMKAIGYKEIVPYIHETAPLESCVELLKRNSRRYAKRQYTWFKNKMNVNWYSVTQETYEKQVEKIVSDVKEKLF